MPETLVTSRRRFNLISQLRVGVDSANYSYILGASGIGPVEWEENDIIRKIEIPKGDNAVKQKIGNPDIIGNMAVYDYEALTVLLYETDVDGSSNKAVTITDRNTIGYFALVVKNSEVVNVPNTRTQETSTFSFANVVIGRIIKNFPPPWMFEFYADSVTQVDT